MRAVVAGHICLDVIPSFGPGEWTLESILIPGSLTEVGAATVSTGGAVSNTGIALHKLGIATTLIAKIGDDFLAEITRSVVESHAPGLSRGLATTPGAGSSYTLVLNPPGVDRMFLHHPGPNDAFGSEDLDPEVLKEASLFHFGYPPLMRRMFENEGRELESVFKVAKNAGLVTSLDVTMPDPARAQGKAPWLAILRRVLPLVDLFVPSIDEVGYMLDPAAGCFSPADAGGRLLDLGASLVLLKLGENGLYLRTGRVDAVKRLGQDPQAWEDLELSAPAYDVEVAGTTGCGDSTIAGFLAAMMNGLGPAECLDVAAAVGAHVAERPDALSGVPDWSSLRRRMSAPWARKPQTR